MQITGPGIKEGLVYQKTVVWAPSETLLMRKERYETVTGFEHCPLDEWIESQDWSWVSEPEQRSVSIRSEENWREAMKEELSSPCCKYFWIVAYKDPDEELEYRKSKIYPYIEVGDLEAAIFRAAAVFAKDAIIKTIEKPVFGCGGFMGSTCRDYPVSEGILQYFRKEFRKRRQQLIREID